MKHQLILATMLALGAPAILAQSYFDDDIYYNPKKDKTSTQTVKKKKQSNYIANMADMDVDAYNRRGEQYYTTAIDTIGSRTENGEDFVYTQQIQKYYNPTIVVDNADMLGDVLANTYGNVDIVIDASGLPVFAPYSYAWSYPWNRWGYPGWGINVGPWGWNVGFYDPWYAWNWGWNWGPSWSWGPSWAWGPSWGWVPSWGWGPAWGPSWGPGWGGGPRPPMADFRPNGNRPVGPRPGWSGNTRPGGNLAHRGPGNSGSSVSRPGSSNAGWSNNTRPGSSTTRPGSISSRPGGNHVGVVNNNGRWEYNTTATSGHRRAGTGAVNSGNTTNRSNGNVVNRGATNNRNTNNNYNRNTNSNYNRNNNANRNYNYNSNRSFNTGRSTGGGSFGGGRTVGGGRTTGGGGSRGHR